MSMLLVSCVLHEQRKMSVAGELSSAVRCFHSEETIHAQMYDRILYTTIRNIFKGMRNMFVYTCCEVVSAWNLELAILLLNWMVTTGCSRQLGLGDLGERLDVPWGKL